MKTNLLRVLSMVIPAAALLLSGCSKDAISPKVYKVWHFDPAADNQTAVQAALIEMANGDTIEFSAGTFVFTGTLSVDGKDSIVIRGAGRTATTLDFSTQSVGAEGIYGNDLNWCLMRDFTVKDTKGDGIKVKDSDGISFVRVGAIYSGIADPTNGSYGLYPVTSSNVYINDCYVNGCSDAGIYVGQSHQVIVKNSFVEYSVAGIEIENCVNSDVYGNTARHNTGGILVFDLPTLQVVKNGNTTRVYDNLVDSNNLVNFAPAGNTVGNVPVGTGIMLLASNKTEIFNNTITFNNIMSLGIVSYKTLEFFTGSPTTDTIYNPYVEDIHIYNNTFSSDHTSIVTADLNQMSNTINGLLFNNPSDIPDIIYDGFFDPALNQADATESVCIHGNGSATFSDVDADHGFTNFSSNIGVHNCVKNLLPTVEVNAPGM